MKFLKDSSGNPSLTATMAIVSFVVVMAKVAVSGASVALASGTYSFGTIDSYTVAAIFTPILGAYLGRRHLDSGDAAQPTAAPAVGGGAGVAHHDGAA